MKTDIEEEQASLERLLGSDTVATPATLSAGLRWLLSMLRQELSERPAPGQQVYVGISDVAKRYGVGKNVACAWLYRLRELGKVRVQVPMSGKSDKGDRLYYLPDIEKAFAENAQRVETIKRS